MPIRKWLRARRDKPSDTKTTIEGDVDDQQQQQQEEEEKILNGTTLIYFACNTPKDDLINLLENLSTDVRIFIIENECIEYIKSITNKAFLIVDGEPSKRFIEELDKFEQIDSVFVYSKTVNDSKIFDYKEHHYLVNWCENEGILTDSMKKSFEQLEKQIALCSVYDKEEKFFRHLSKAPGSYLFFQLAKIIIYNMPKTAQAKQNMIKIVQNYYRKNSKELANIDDFDRNYRSTDAIPWFTKECFLSKFINRALRTEDAYVLYDLRFYINDLSEAIQKKSLQLRAKKPNNLKLYRYEILTDEQRKKFQNSIGKLISINGYLSLHSQRSIAYDFLRKTAETTGVQYVLFEYEIQLNTVQSISVADIREYLAYPEQADFLVDMGASFQIDSCTYNSEENSWHIQIHATDQGTALASDYMEYQKKKIKESNICLMFGDLLIEMGEYSTAERYFDTLLCTENPNDEEIACIFYSFGRVHRLKGDLNRAINCYHRAHSLHMDAKPKRPVSAGKALNGLGTVYCQKDQLLKAEECFRQAMNLFKKGLPNKNVDAAATLINLGFIDSERGNYDEAISKYLQAKKMYDSILPPSHPNCALPRVNLGNVYLSIGQYEKALEEYQSALTIQEASLPFDHPDIARTLQNITMLHEQQENLQPEKDQITTPTGKTKNVLVE